MVPDNPQLAGIAFGRRIYYIIMVMSEAHGPHAVLFAEDGLAMNAVSTVVEID